MAQEVKYLSYSGLSYFKDKVFEVINPLISENNANILSIHKFLENPVFEKVNIDTLNVIDEINLNGTRVFNFDFLPLTGGTLTGPLVFNGSDTDRNVIRINCASGDSSQIGNYGYTLKFLGSGSGVNNALALYADNQTATTQNLATKWLNDGTMYSRSIIPHTTNTFDLGSSSLNWKNVYATKFTGSGFVHSGVTNDAANTVLTADGGYKSISDIMTLADAMVFKGTITSNSQLPATHKQGWTYRVNTAGTYADKVCEVGDLIICIADGTSANNAHWTVAQTNIDGAVIGPASSVSGNIAAFNSANGKSIYNTGLTLSNIATSGHSHSNASTATAGFMSTSDKSKLDGIASGANNYTHPDSHPASMITGLATVATSGSYNDLSNTPISMTHDDIDEIFEKEQ